MKRLLLMMFVTEMSLLGTFAATINCPTCSQADFQTALYSQANDGDVIVLPAGSATWGDPSQTVGTSNNGTIFITKNITVVGQGDSTVITLADSGATFSNGVIALWSASTFKHLKIIGSSVNPVTAFSMSPFSDSTHTFSGGFRISDVTYVGGTADGYFAFVAQGVNHGLIDNCRITGNSGSDELIFGRGPVDAWQTSDTLGTANNIFIEGCTFSGQGYVCDANSNARFVIRFCTITSQMKVDGHGLASNSPARSVRHMEVYKNHWTDNGQFGAAFELRGGTYMIFDNASDNTHGANGDFFQLTDYGYQALWPNFAFVYQTPDVYPLTDQIGLGKDPKSPHSQPSYIWNNVKNGAPWTRNLESPELLTASTDATGYPAGSTSITLTSIPAKMYPGNGIAFAGDNARYFIMNIVSTGASANPVTVSISPGLAQAIPAAPTAVTMGAVTTYQTRTSNPSATFTEADVIQSNRDFYADAGFDVNTGVSRGTTAQMNALVPSFAGYGFWVTDQGSWNTTVAANTSGLLYVWNGSAWVLKYTPYIYPHPLRTPRAPSALQLGP